MPRSDRVPALPAGDAGARCARPASRFSCPTCKKAFHRRVAPAPAARSVAPAHRRAPCDAAGLRTLRCPGRRRSRRSSPLPRPRARSRVATAAPRTPNVCPACKSPLLPGRHRLHGLRLPDPGRRRRRPRPKGRPTSAPTRPAASPTRPASATASAAARRCRPPRAPCCTAATASTSCWRWAASARSTWRPTPRHGNRPVAIKDMICADPQEFAIRLNFFRREAEILRSLEKLPMVPRVYDLIEQGQTAHLVLEFIRGQDLLKLMETNNNGRSRSSRSSNGARASATCWPHMHTQVAAAGPSRSEAGQHHAAGGPAQRSR